MPLRSQHFQDDARLQACLVSDPAHVTPGQSGNHVALIQFALMRLLVADIPQSEIDKKRYGPKTAAAVLKLKEALDIVNHRYQKKADNIVGKMTIRELDDLMLILEGGPGLLRQPNLLAIHPTSPRPPITPPVIGAKPAASGGAVRAGLRSSALADEGARGAEDAAFAPPLSLLPADLQAVIRKSNAAKKPGDLMLFPFIANHEGPVSGPELSRRFEKHKIPMAVLLDVQRRMGPFGLFAHVRLIHNVFTGIGSRGFQCEPVDHGKYLAHMIRLCRGPDPKERLRQSPFCKDAFNVHGPRESFREIVKAGEGLHICITEFAHRRDTHCDMHIDAIQQGQVCFDGMCVPLVNKQTADHVKSVGPWLAQEAKDKIVDWAKKKLLL